VNFFADTFITKALPHIFAGQRAQSDAEKDEAAEALVAAVVKELEPLFTWDATKGAFFGGSDRLTLAEVCASMYPTHSKLDERSLREPFI
jgi:glutathione S-transferase